MTQSNSDRRVCLVGAGYIAGVHAEALRSLHIPISVVVDPHSAAREKLAHDFKISNAYGTIQEAIAAGGFGRAHVLVPPDLHASAALPLIRAAKSVLIEKPIATTLASCDELIEACGQDGKVGVNQNFVFHPAFVRLRDALSKRRLGKPKFVEVLYHAPLRQLAARQFGHWMFREPRNILLEQAVHPLSQLVLLTGDIETLHAIGGDEIEIASGNKLALSFTAAIRGNLVPASLRFAVGQEFPFWQVKVLCDDGVLLAEMLSNQFWMAKRTRWMDAVDAFVSGQASAGSVAAESWKNFLHYGLSAVKISPRSDAFFRSMQDSIATFHSAVDEGAAPSLDGNFGRKLVELCDRIAVQTAPQMTRPPATSGAAAQVASAKTDVAALGGTGFIGTALVTQLRAAGLTVSVMARNLSNLPDIFQDSGVKLQRGDIRNAVDVARAIAGAGCVVNLAHGGGGESWDEIRDAMVGGAETVANACLDAKIKRLVHVGSIAALYLGPQSNLVTGAAPPDPHAERRSDYARAKAMAEHRLRQMLHGTDLELCILRPGLVVGSGTSPFHSGLGFYNNDQHCIGWNDGRNPLPFVLVDDTARAILAACTNPSAAGKCYNLVGDFCPSARDYLEELARILQRPLKFHGKTPYGLYANELGKWCIKRAGGRHVPLPSLRDILSRGLTARFDCSDAKNDLGWKPVADPSEFYGQAFGALS